MALHSDVPQAYEELCAVWRSIDRAQKDELLAQFAVLFAYNSGNIENDAITYHDTHEVFESGMLSSFSGDVRTVFEIQNQRFAWQWLLDAAARGAALSESDILHVHEVLTRGTISTTAWNAGERPGAYKRGDYVVGAYDVGASADDVPALVNSLVGELHEVWRQIGKPSKALTAASYLHAELVDIHPFCDGNGRTARLLMNYVLLCAGCPPVAVRQEHRSAYYGALDAYHLEGDLDSLKAFVMSEALLDWGFLLAASPQGDFKGVSS